MMCIIKKWAVVACLLPLQVFSQQDTVLSINEILEQINHNNVQLQSYELRAKSYGYSADAATAWMAPMVGVGTFMTPLPGQMKMQPSDAGSLMFRLEQDIPNGSKLRAQKRYIESQAPVELAARKEAFNNLKSLAKTQYYSWLVASQRVNVLRRNVEVMEMMQKIEEVRYPYNQSQLSSVFQAAARVEENRNMIRMQEGEIGRARAILNGLMNRPGLQRFIIDTAQSLQLVPVLFDTASLAASRGDVLRMNQSIRSMELNIAAMRQQRKPDFKVQYDQMLPLDKAMPKSYSVMGMVSIPLAPWSSKMYKSDIKAMEFSIQAMEKERDAMLQESQGMLYGMQAEITSMQQRIRSMETKVIPSLKNALDANMLNYRENKVQLPLVIQTWDALNMMQLDLLDEKLKLYQMIVDYEKELYR